MQFFLVKSWDLRVKSFGEFFFITLRKIFDFVIWDLGFGILLGAGEYRCNLAICKFEKPVSDKI